ncbi:MAG: hypothetical protein FWE59_01875, partial [Oscillospiraceae bacterium]|nr:hypothetical protein [Oscillospiraceae bacterium]
MKKMAVSRVFDHPWKDMDEMEIFKSAGLYSGGEPELIEGDIFKTIIPLVSASGKQAEKTSGKKDAIVGYIEEHGEVTAAELTELFGLSEGRVRAILLEMVKD